MGPAILYLATSSTPTITQFFDHTVSYVTVWTKQQTCLLTLFD